MADRQVALQNYKGAPRANTSANACHFSAVCARWQRYIQLTFALTDNGKKSFNPILDPDADPNYHRNNHL